MNKFGITKFSLVALMAMAIASAGCKKEKNEEDMSSTPSDSFSMTIDGTTYTGTIISNQYDNAQQYLHVAVDCQNGVLAWFEMNGQVPPGTYTSNLGFGVQYGLSAYVCSGCVFEVETHNVGNRYLKFTVSGGLNEVVGSNTQTLDIATISVNY